MTAARSPLLTCHVCVSGFYCPLHFLALYSLLDARILSLKIRDEEIAVRVERTGDTHLALAVDQSDHQSLHLVRHSPKC